MQGLLRKTPMSQILRQYKVNKITGFYTCHFKNILLIKIDFNCLDEELIQSNNQTDSLFNLENNVSA